ncbi:hypothetical protein RRG08_043226, partial [Elysia crispata]
MDAQVATRS